MGSRKGRKETVVEGFAVYSVSAWQCDGRARLESAKSREVVKVREREVDVRIRAFPSRSSQLARR